MTSITFEKASLKHKDIIFNWLAEPHMVEFWDNSQEHKDDILNFIDGRKVKSTYFNGIFTYWIGSINGEPYSLIMSAEVTGDENDLWKAHTSKTGKTISIDFGIGNKDFLGKGLAAPTLKAFCQFYQNEIDGEVDTFFIDPDADNPRAAHVYDKAGFKKVGEYEMQNGVFKGSNTYLMVKNIYWK
jgi:RimJ/RimL family protein N-acetyltransferase